MKSNLEGLVTHVEELSNKKSKLVLFPNPASVFVNIDWGVEATGVLQLYDISGKQVKEIKLEQQRELNIPITGLVPSIYFVRLLDRITGEIWTAHFIKV